MNISTFEGLNLRPEILRSLSEMGFEAPTSIQASCIPPILEGKDLVGQAQTGTGKTAAFGIPVLTKIDIDQRKVQALIQCPTRELAIQVTGELLKIGQFMKGIQVVPVYGGQPIQRQITAIKRGAQIIVGTPGRTIDHLKRGTLDISGISMLVFDEADEMLNMGFREDMEEILTYTSGKMQKVMFSATVPPAIRSIMKTYMNDPVNIQADRKALTAPDIEQYVMDVRESVRTEAISRLMDVNGYNLGLVFSNTKRQTEAIARDLQARGFSAEIINGDLSQGQRDAVMSKFRGGKIDLLVATDVAARGIDVSGVDVVFNFEIPQDPEYYIHRIGRTGRAGRKGTSITFSAGRKSRRLKSIEKQIGINLKPLAMPSVEDVKMSKINSHIEKLEEILNTGGLKPYIIEIERMAEGGFSIPELAAGLLKMQIGEVEKPVKEEVITANYDNSNMTRLKLSLGKKHKIRPGDIVGAIAGEANIPGDAIGEIVIKQEFSLVDIPTGLSAQVMDAINRSQIKGKKVRVQLS
jgi:ATP-dependent RNA helicase DeaD